MSKITSTHNLRNVLENMFKFFTSVSLSFSISIILVALQNDYYNYYNYNIHIQNDYYNYYNYNIHIQNEVKRNKVKLNLQIQKKFVHIDSFQSVYGSTIAQS